MTLRPLASLSSVLGRIAFVAALGCGVDLATGMPVHAAMTQDVAATPTQSVLDPSTFALIGLGLIGLAIFRRRARESDEG